MIDLPDLSGIRLKNYELIKSIGHGGMAHVYLAKRAFAGEDGQFEQRVAIKILAKMTPENVRRFEQEMQVLIRLQHPHIVRVNDYLRLDGKQIGVLGQLHCIVMDYLEGGSLVDYITAAEGLPVQKFIENLRQVALALDAAHENSIIHRDVKPHNILFDKGGNAYLTDFGIARLFEQEALPDHRDLTKPRQIIGTLPYMAPEMFDPDQEITEQVDLYALGVVAFHVLGHQKPFDADNDYDLIFKVLRQTPPLLSDVNSEIPVEVAEVIQRALSKDPQARYPSAVAFVNDLDRKFEVADTVMVTSPPDFWRMARTPYRFGSVITEHAQGLRRLAMVLGFLIGIVLFMGIIALASNTNGSGQRSNNPFPPPSNTISAGQLQILTPSAVVILALTPVATNTGTEAPGASSLVPLPSFTPHVNPSITAIPTLSVETVQRENGGDRSASTTPTTAATLTATPPSSDTPTVAPSATPQENESDREAVMADASIGSLMDASVTPRPTDTPVPPTNTPTFTPIPTDTPTSTVTLTSTVTPIPSATPMSAAVAVFTGLITNAEYKRCKDARVCMIDPKHMEQFHNPAFSGRPLVSANWHAAQDYCLWWGGRLPTEDEWRRMVLAREIVPGPGMLEWVIDDLSRLDDLRLYPKDAWVVARGAGEQAVRMEADESTLDIVFRCVRP